MYALMNPICWDEYGNEITHLTQWDKNQRLVLEYSPTTEIIAPPYIDYYNETTTEESIRVQSEIINDKIVADIPNPLLEQPYNIFAYVRLSDNATERITSNRTVAILKIPVVPSVKPGEHIFDNPYTAVTLDDVNQLAKKNEHGIQMILRGMVNGLHYAGQTTFDKLPENSIMGDYYYCTDKEVYYAWNGFKWYEIETFTLEHFYEVQRLEKESLDHMNAAIDAQEAAELAQERSEFAQSKSEEAQRKSETAQSLSEKAQGLSETAQKAAEEAQRLAEDAQAKAEDARDKAQASEQKAGQHASNSLASENKAKASETNAAKSEVNAKTSEQNAAASASASAQSASESAVSASAALASEKAAKISEQNAKTSEANAKVSETNAKTSENNAKNHADQTVECLNDAVLVVENYEALLKRFEELSTDLTAKVTSAIPKVGDLEFNVTGENPSTKYSGTTWVAWGSGRVPVGVNTSDVDFNAPEKTGGTKTERLSSGQIPSHTHSISYNSEVSSGTETGKFAHSANSGTTSTNNSSSTQGQAHNNLQPYITCYIWKRTR